MLKSSQLGGGIPLRMPFSPERNFNYAKPIRIRNPTVKYFNYILTINLTENNFDFSEARSDGRDIRFKDANRKLLQYRIQSWDSSSKIAEIKILIPELDAYDEKIIWMFYGNKNSIDQSIAYNDLIYSFFDDFNYLWTDSDLTEGEHPDWDIKWGNYQRHAYSRSRIFDDGIFSSRMAFSYQVGGYTSWETKRTILNSFIVEFRARIDDYGGGSSMEIRISGDDTKFKWHKGQVSAATLYLYRSDGSSTSTNVSLHYGSYHNVKIIFDINDYKVYVDDIERISTTNTSSLSSPQISMRYYSDGSDLWSVDWFKVSSYFPIEPTYEFI